MKPIHINWQNFLRGESVSNEAATGGFSPRSYGLVLTKTRGLLYFAEASTDRGGATLTGNILASTYDKNILGNDTYHLDDEGAFYTLNGSTFTKRQTVTADTFTLGTTDFLQFQGNTFATSNTRVIMLTGSDLATVDSSWWTGLTTSYRHPIERVEDTLYIADVNQIHTWNGTTSTAAAITLPTDANITSLRKHPDGRTLIAFCGLTADFSHTKPNPGRIYLIDTNTKNWVREIDIDMQVEGSRVVGGVVYVTYGQNVGYFDGNAVQFLKRLDTSTTTYSHNMTDWEGVLLVRDGRNLLAFGDLGLGQKVWWKPYRNDVSSASINNIIYKGSDKVMISFTDGGSAGVLREQALNNTGVSGQFYFNFFDFQNESIVRRFEALHVPVTGATLFNLNVEEDLMSPDQVWRSNPDGVSAEWAFYRVGIDVTSHRPQFNIGPSTTALGFKFFRFFYEPIA